MNKKPQKLDENLLTRIVNKYNVKDLDSLTSLFKQFKKQVIERILSEEINDNLGYDKHSKENKNRTNRRNGTYSKNIIDSNGSNININVPRDRENQYEPLLIPKGIRRFPNFDDKVISLYARGMTNKEIQGHLEELYQTEISTDLISKITDTVIEEVNQWQNRPLDKPYPILFLDCIHVKSRENNLIINKAVYLAIGINMEGKKQLLGIWISKNEGSKFWIQVCTELKSRGLEEIYISCVDGLKGFPEAT